MKKNKEGDLYKILNVHGRQFEIRYGYYSDEERRIWEPTPIFPNFTKTPLYTNDGMPYVTAEQDVCMHYKPGIHISDESWCNDCIFYESGEEIIGVCTCKKNRNDVRQNE